MKKSLLFIFLISSVISKAQTEWFPIGAEWYFEEEAYSFNYDYLGSGFSKYEVVKDTLVLGKSAKFIQKEKWDYEGVYSANINSLILYEESEQVYYLDQDSFYLMFDFNLETGDTLPHRMDLYNEGCFFDLVIDSVKTVSYFGVSLKTQYVSRIGLFGGTFMTYNYTVVEKIGVVDVFDNYGFLKDYSGELTFHPYHFCNNPTPYDPTSRNHIDLRCYQDNDISFTSDWFEGKPCDTLIDITVSALGISGNQLNLFPNPVLKHFQLELETNNNIIKIINIQGQVVYQEQVQNKTPIINIEHLSAGIYSVVIIDESGRTTTGKFIKE